MSDSNLAIRTLRESLKVAEEKRQSTLHSFDDGIDKMKQNSVINDNSYERGIFVQIVVLRQVIKTAGTEHFKQNLISSLRDIIESDETDLSPVEEAHLMRMADEVTFADMISPRDSKQLNADEIDNLVSDGGGGMSATALNTFAEVARIEIQNTDRYLHDYLTSLIMELEEVLGPEPVKSDWEKAHIILGEHFTELDEEIRFIGDVT